MPQTITGDAGDNLLTGNAGNDTISGLAGNDTLIGRAGADALAGGSGADIFRYLTATDSTPAAYDIIGDFETGIDRIDVSALNTSSISVIRESGSSFVFAQSPGGAFQLIASGAAINGSDFTYSGQHGVYLIGSSAGETLIGSTYGDPIQGNGGDDTLIGGLGGDAISGGAGADAFVYRSASESSAAGYDNLYDFETGIDRIDVSALNTSSLSVIREAGSSFVFADSPGGAFQLVAAGRAINGSDFVQGGQHGVYLIGSAAGETLVGSAYGDPLQGNGGDDVLIGGLGGDAISGGAGADTFVYRSAAESNAAGYDNLYDFETGIDRIDVSALNTTSLAILRVDGSSFVFADSPGGAFQFIAAGRAINASDIAGLSHGVYLVGSEEPDVLVGSAGADSIIGGGGQDRIVGGAGADYLAGGAGQDVFAFTAASASTLAAPDLIGDFVSGVDRIDLTAARTGAADSFGIAHSGGGSFLFVDLGGNGSNDMLIQLANTTLGASDLIW